jgi:hypothetical protein
MNEDTQGRSGEIDWVLSTRQLLGSFSFRKVSRTYYPLSLSPLHFNYGSIKPPPLKLTAIIKKETRVVLLGEPGAGKTWTLKHAILKEGDDFLQGRYKRLRIPIYSELRDWNVSAKALSDGPSYVELIHFMSKFIPQVSHLANPQTAVLSELGLKQFLLVFDGLDEILDLRQRIGFVESLSDFLDKPEYAEHNIVIGSRKYGFLGGDISHTLQRLGFKVFEIAGLDEKSKLAIIDRYLPPRLDLEEANRRITSDYYTARLSNNALLLSLLAQDYDLSRRTPNTRGRILQKHIDKLIGSCQTLPEEPAKDFLSHLAMLMRERQRHRLRLGQEVMPEIDQFLGSHSLPNTAPQDFLEMLLKTRIIESHPNTYQEVSFALPQYEEYFQARMVFADLQLKIQSAPSKIVRGLKYVTDKEWHYILGLSAGLLEQQDAERLAGALDDSADMLLKARIFGDAYAPESERQFISYINEELNKKIRFALKRLSLGIIGTLVIWWLGILPVAFFMNGIWDESVSVGLATLTCYLLIIPLLVRVLFPRLFRHYASQLTKRHLPKLLSAITFLRSGAAQRNLQNLLTFVQRQLPRDIEGDDLFKQLVESISRDIQQAIHLTGQDLDTILDQVEKNSFYIEYWLVTPPESFLANDVEFFERLLNKSGTEWLNMQIKCLKKLREVAQCNESLRGQILESIKRLASHTTLNADLERHAVEAINSIEASSRRDNTSNQMPYLFAGVSRSAISLFISALLLTWAGLLFPLVKYAGKARRYWLVGDFTSMTDSSALMYACGVQLAISFLITNWIMLPALYKVLVTRQIGPGERINNVLGVKLWLALKMSMGFFAVEIVVGLLINLVVPSVQHLIGK